MILNNGMKWKDQSPKMLELKQATLSRVRGFLGQTGFCMYDWFIPLTTWSVETQLSVTKTKKLSRVLGFMTESARR